MLLLSQYTRLTYGQTDSAVKTRMNDCGMRIWAELCFVLLLQSQSTRLIDRQTDRRLSPGYTVRNCVAVHEVLW